jgi:hypothetical protein
MLAELVHGRRKKTYKAYLGRDKKKPRPRRLLPCWLYGELYQARNAFLHGNPITVKRLALKGSKVGLFWLAAPLYRLALTGFLQLAFTRKNPPASKPKEFGEFVNKRMIYYEYQEIIERALLRARNRRKP